MLPARAGGAIALALGCLLAVPAAAAAEHPWTVLFNGRPVRHAKAIVRNGSAYIDMVTAIRTWDGLVTFDHDVVTASVGDNVAVFRVGDDEVNVNGHLVRMAAAPFRWDGDVYVPLDFFGKRVGSATVRLVPARSTIVISAKPAAS